jgi:hypothetical protein
MPSNKKVRIELKSQAKELLEAVLPSLRQRTINKYADDIRYTENINSLRKIIRELSLLNDASKLEKKGVELSKSSLKKIRAEKKLINESMTTVFTKASERKTYFKEALNGTFKETYLNVVDMPNVEEKEIDIFKTPAIISKLIVTKLNDELKNSTALINKKVKKVSIRSFITIACTIYKMESRMHKGKMIKKRVIKDFYYNSKIKTLASSNNITTFISDVYNDFLNALEESRNGSDWLFEKYVRFTIGTNTYKSAFAGSYIPLPDSISKKKACVNIKNNDEACFDWCLLAHKFYDTIKSKDKNLTYHYKKHWEAITRPENVQYPVDENQIEEYENLNNMQINVWELSADFKDDGDVRKYLNVIYKSNQHRKDVVNLLLLNSNDNCHYVYIKNLSRLFNYDEDARTKFYCPHCITKSFPNNDKLQTHMFDCAKYSESERKECDIIYEMPSESKGNNIMQFKNRGHDFLHPFHVIADFESTLVPYVDNRECDTKKYQQHIPNSFGVKYCSIHDESDEPVYLYNNANPEEVCREFVEKLEQYAHQSYAYIKENETNIDWNFTDMINHKNAVRCENCGCDFDDNKNKKCAHHDHITGAYISALCSKCNLLLSYKRFLPVYLHNLKGYDAHLFVNSLYKFGQRDCDVSCIPNNEERYISFSKVITVDHYTNKKGEVKPVTFEIRFLDTIGFMNSSIESLVNNLKKGCTTIKDLRSKFPNTSKYFTNDSQFNRMTQKGIYPYDYIDNFNRLNETKLPAIKEFSSKLNGTVCSPKEYERADQVWKEFQCEKFMDYHNLYLASDVLLLADVWASFRNTCFTNYKLDCTYYFTAPGLSFDAMLKHTDVKLQLFTELDMYEFVEKGIRGGLSQISTRYAQANNKYMGKDYNKKKEDSYILYLDANALYSWAMSQYLPVSDFKWNSEQWTKEKIMNIESEAKTGYMFEVDLSFPKELHDKMNNYVPLPDNIQVKKDDLNEWQKENYHESKIRKLCCSFKNRSKYVVNYRNLKLALSLGVKLENVHRVLEFKQSNFMKSYIDLNTDLRKQSKNEFEKDFFKLMNNSVFGKTMENVRNRINFRLVSTNDQAWRVKNLKHFNIFSETLVGVHIQKKTIKLDKPVYLGQTILDDSKYLMNDFHYNFMLKKIPREDLDLLFTDTDSLCYHIRKHDIFQIMKDNKDKFDLSDYPVGHELHDPTNKKVAGVFKNESIAPITKFVGLRAKLYSYSVHNDNENHLRCKGVKKGVANRELNIKMYESILMNRKTKSVNQNGIRSYAHNVFTESCSKVALSGRDDKVFICDNNINTYNFGHYKTL